MHIKLYWRYKKAGKWTWAAARVEVDNETEAYIQGWVSKILEEEE